MNTDWLAGSIETVHRFSALPTKDYKARLQRITLNLNQHRVDIMNIAKVLNIALTVILVLVVVALASVVAAVGFSSLLVSTGSIVIFVVVVAVVSVVAVMITVPMAAAAYDKEQEFNAHYGL